MSKLSLPISILALVASIATFFYFQASQSEQVYVDVNQLLDGYKRTAIVKAEFQKKATAMKSNVDSLLGSWQKELKDYEKERSSMTAKEIELKQELLSNRQQQINGYQKAIQKQLQEEDLKSTQTVTNDINDFVKEYGKNNGYQIILGATGGGTIMYADEGANLTEEILNELNREFEGF